MRTEDVKLEKLIYEYMANHRNRMLSEELIGWTLTYGGDGNSVTVNLHFDDMLGDEEDA